MLTFTERMKRIIQLSEQSLVHAQAERFEPSAKCLINISTNVNVAIQLLDEMSFRKDQGKDPAVMNEGGP